MPATSVKRLKVLQIGKFYPPHRGGMENHLKLLCDQMLPDIDVEAIVSNTTSNTAREVFDGVPVIRLGCVARLASTSVNPGMASEIRWSNPDLVHLHWPNPMGALAWLTSGHRGPLVITYHSDVVKQRALGHLFAPVLQTILSRAAAILISSEEYAESSKVLRPRRDLCTVVPFGISPDFFKKKDDKAVSEIRSQYGDKLVLSVGRLVDYKGFGVLIRAMASAPGRLLIAGDGPLRNQLTTLAHSLGLADRVIFTGEPSDRHLRNLYNAADVFVLASTDRREAFGLVQAEAMAAGKPVINTNLASGVQSVSPGEVTGLAVPPSDSISLAAAITRLLNDGSLRAKLGQAARQRAESMFRCETMAARTLQIYERALGAGERTSQRPASQKYGGGFGEQSHTANI